MYTAIFGCENCGCTCLCAISVLYSGILFNLVQQLNRNTAEKGTHITSVSRQNYKWTTKEVSIKQKQSISVKYLSKNFGKGISKCIILSGCFLKFLFLIGIHSMQGWTATTRHGVTRKEAQKKITGHRKSV